MSDTVISGCITALASIIVALIAHRQKSGGTASAQVVPRQRSVSLSWWVVGLAIMLFAGLAPALIHHDLAGMAIFIIPFATLILAFTAPINPLSSVSITLALHAANFFLGPLGNQLAGSQYDATFNTDVFFNPTVLAIVLGNAVIVGLVSWYSRPRRFVQATSNAPSPSTERRADELEKLARLLKEGALTQEEFDREKRRILQ